MKFDKETVIVFVICIIALLGWQPLCEHMGWYSSPVQPQTAAAPEQAPAIPAAPAAKSSEAPEAKNALDAGKNLPSAVKSIPPVKLENDLIELSFSPAEGEIKSLLLKKFLDSTMKENIVLYRNISPGALAVFPGSEWKLADAKLLDSDKSSVKISRKFKHASQLIEIIQTLKLTDASYVMSYNLEIKNLSDSDVNIPALTINAGALPPLNILAGDTTRSETHGIEWCQGLNHQIKFFGAADKEEKFKTATTEVPLLWVAISNRYFASILIPAKQFNDGAVADRQKIASAPHPDETFSASVSGRYKTFSIKPGNVENISMKYFAGPKEVSILRQLGESTDQIMHLSFWSALEWITQWMLVALNYLKGICGSYGWAIIILTIIVRAIFWPITQRANNSMKKMQRLQPKIQALKEKFKDNPQMMNSKMMELYREEKVNPLGGCLPILLQLPVFFALYAALDGAVELRHTSFMWCHDLSLPDTVAHIFGLPINPLILIMTAFMVLQQKITPASPDPMQQKMMMFMPLIMLIFLYSLPSGLTLYWTVSQIISIIQLLINKGPSVKQADKPKTAGA